MILHHLRNNIVAYLALTVALTLGLGGVAYAAVHLQNGQVKTRHLADGAVTKKKIRTGVLRPARILLASTEDVAGPAGDPAASPDQFLGGPSVASPRTGRVLVRFSMGALGMTCTTGIGFVGMYLDGQPVRGTRVSLNAPAEMHHVELVRAVTLTKGQHDLVIGRDCPGAATIASTDSAAPVTWTVLLPGG
jgi:hypothetical protein